jgi:hypothetical protein
MRETAYTPDLAVTICRRVADGESLREVCRDDNMPPESTVRGWVLDDRDGFAARYGEARALLVERWADEIIEIADNVQLEPNDRRVKIDVRKWLMSRLAPLRYGDRLLHVGDPENPVLVLHKAARIEALTQAELAALDTFAQARLTIIDVEPIEGEQAGS